MKRSNRVFRIAAILLAMITLLWIWVTVSEEIRFKDGEGSVIPYGAQDGSVLLSTPDSQDVDWLPTGLEVIRDRKILPDKTGTLMADPNHLALLADFGDKQYLLADQIAAELYSTVWFDDFFPVRQTQPVVLMTQDGSQTAAHQLLDWAAPLPDGSERRFSESTDSVDAFILADGDELIAESAIWPDRIVASDADGTAVSWSGKTLLVQQAEALQTITIHAQWDRDDLTAEEILKFTVQTDLPMAMMEEPSPVTPGQLLMIRLKNTALDGEIRIMHPFSGASSISRSGDIATLLIPVDYWTDPGTYQVFVESTENSDSLAISVTVTPRQFGVQQLVIDETVAASTRNDEAYAEYDLYMVPARESSANQPLFTGAFILPVEGRVSTEFGMYRYVNGSLTSYRHSGIDLAAPAGTPVLAAQSGTVALARPLILTGNTVVIDHGLGLFSVYFHMESLSVSDGQSVTQGEEIGKVGSTGFSTGPHLHWTLSHYRINLDPEQFMEQPLF